MTDLLPCPFCGEKPFERLEKNPNGPKYPDHWTVWCENLECTASPETFEETQEASRVAWNTRTLAPAQATRKDIAKIVDPDAWKRRDRERGGIGLACFLTMDRRDAAFAKADEIVAPSLAKADAILSLVSSTEPAQAPVNPVCDLQALLEIRDFLADIVGGAEVTERARDTATGFVSIMDSQFKAAWASSVSSTESATPSNPRIAERLSDVAMMLETPDAYNREYIAAVCRSILSSVAGTHQAPDEDCACVGAVIGSHDSSCPHAVSRPESGTP